MLRERKLIVDESVNASTSGVESGYTIRDVETVEIGCFVKVLIVPIPPPVLGRFRNDQCIGRCIDIAPSSDEVVSFVGELIGD